MSEHAPDFVYTIYISAPIDRVWNGLIDRDLTRAYWSHDNVSDWRQGSRWEHVRCDGSGTVDIVGKVLEFDAPRRMVWTWASPEGEGIAERTSRVTYELTSLGTETRLKVTHSELEAGSAMLAGISKGWPAVLSNLKSLLETGEAMSERIWSKADA